MDNSGDNTVGGPTDTDPAAATVEDALGRLAGLQRQFATTIGEVDPSTPVPWCGGWQVGDLVEHLTYIHHWAAALARSEDHPDDQRVDGQQQGDGPATSAQLALRYEAAAADLLDTLTALPPDTPARTLVDDGTVAFWHRRQLHETLVHLWDLLTAAGQPLAVDPGLWADTVDEAVTVMHPRQLRLGRAAGAPGRLALVADDVGRTWTLPGPGRTEDALAASVTGSAEALALLVWGRTDLADHRLRVDGDATALQTVLDDHFLP